MNQRPKILLLIPHLGGGGAEQVTALLARHLSEQKYEIHLGLITQPDAGAEPLPASVTVHGLNAHRVRSGGLRLLRLVWRLRPEVILSGMAHLNFLVLLLRPLFPKRTRIVVRQNGTVSSSLGFGDLPAYTVLLYRVLYRHADRVICQSKAMAEDVRREIGAACKHLVVLRNPVDVDGIRATEGAMNPWTGPGPHLLAVGRLSREKGFDLLLQALAAARERFLSADLLIAGDGPEANALRAECHALGLDDAVHFLGNVAASAAYFAGASLFVLPSRHEGLPNALLEAAAGGLPIVATPASGGVIDLLSGQPGVWLTREISPGALSESMSAALGALQPGERFSHDWIEEFRVDRAVEAYEELIDAVLTERQR
jgi:glycosyltransferase involved in cell wall biosynthesis